MSFLTLTEFIKTLLGAVTLISLCLLLMSACTDILSASLPACAKRAAPKNFGALSYVRAAFGFRKG